MGFLVAALVFWFASGKDLSYDVSSSVNGDETFLYTESFSTTFQVFVTVIVGIIGGLVTRLCFYLFGKRK